MCWIHLLAVDSSLPHFLASPLRASILFWAHCMWSAVNNDVSVPCVTFTAESFSNLASNFVVGHSNLRLFRLMTETSQRSPYARSYPENELWQNWRTFVRQVRCSTVSLTSHEPASQQLRTQLILSLRRNYARRGIGEDFPIRRKFQTRCLPSCLSVDDSYIIKLDFLGINGRFAGPGDVIYPP